MPAPAGPWSNWATQQLLPHRARKSRSARVRRETGNTAVPAPPGAAVQAARLPEKAVRVVVVLLPFIFSEIPNPLFAGEGPLLPYNLLTFNNSLLSTLCSFLAIGFPRSARDFT